MCTSNIKLATSSYDIVTLTETHLDDSISDGEYYTLKLHGFQTR